MGLTARRPPSGPVAVVVAVVFVSLVGDQMAALALSVRAAHNGQGWLVAGILVAALAPAALLAPLTGQLADRLEARPLLVVTAFGQGLAALLASASNGSASLLGSALALGCLAAVVGPAVFSLVPLMAGGEDRATRVNANLVALQSAATLGGPVLGGSLASVFGSRGVLEADAASFFLMAAVLSAVGLPRRVDAIRSHRPRLLDGFRAIRRDRLTALLLPTLVLVTCASSAEGVSTVFFARDTLHGGPTLLGFVFASWGAGSLLGATVLRSRGNANPAWMLAAGALGIGLAILLAGVLATAAAVVTVFVLGGAGNAAHNIGVRSLLHRRFATDLHGRVFASYVALTNIGVLTGYLLAAPFAAEHSRSVVVASGIGTLVGALLGLVVVRRGDPRTVGPHTDRHAASRAYAS